MDLNFRKLGSGHPLIILHGLYGAGDNWLSIARALSGFCEVYLLDQRNHGNSPHAPDHNYEVLVNDLRDFLGQQGISRTMLLGHSMGGKVAMKFAIEHPGMVSKLMVVDISPGSYLDDSKRNHINLHRDIISALMQVDFSGVRSLSDADAKLKIHLKDIRLRKFLMKNLKKREDGQYQWKINLPVLMDSLSSISDGIIIDDYKGPGTRSFPVLFVRGADSDYVLDEDVDLIKRIFPLSNTATLKNAGHWLHAEQADMFTKTIKTFIIS